MRFRRKKIPVEIPENARYVVTTGGPRGACTGRTLVVPPESNVVIEPVQYTGRITPRPVPIDPYNVEPAFHVRYEEVKIGHMISLKAIKHNVGVIKLQVREVFTDPKRVTRRYWHRYMVNKRREQILQDSRLFR